MVMSCRDFGGRHGVGLMIDGFRRSATMGGMWASLIIEVHPFGDPGSGLATAAPGVQVDARTRI